MLLFYLETKKIAKTKRVYTAKVFFVVSPLCSSYFCKGSLYSMLGTVFLIKFLAPKLLFGLNGFAKAAELMSPSTPVLSYLTPNAN